MLLQTVPPFHPPGTIGGVCQEERWAGGWESGGEVGEWGKVGGVGGAEKGVGGVGREKGGGMEDPPLH